MIISLSYKNGLINYNNTCNNRCISGVFGWDFNSSKEFVTCVRHLNTMFVYLIFFIIARVSPGKMVFGVVPKKNGYLRPRNMIRLFIVYAFLLDSLPLVSVEKSRDGCLVGKEVLILLFECFVGKLF